MKAAYRILAYLVPVLVVLQAAFIAVGLFGLVHWVDNGNTLTKAAIEGDSSRVGGGEALGLHFMGAMALALVALLLLVVSFFAKVERGLMWAGLIAADVVLQWVFGMFGFGAPLIGALHAVNAFVLFGLGMSAATAAARAMRGTARTSASSSVTPA